MAVLKCKMCGAPLNVKEGMTVCECEYCGTKQTVKTENKNYINNIENAAIDNATIYYNDESSVENKLKNADFYLEKLKDIEKAKAVYKDVTERKSTEYRGWWGLVRCITDDFKLDICTDSKYDEIQKYADAAIKAASGGKAEELKNVWSEYSEKLKANIENKKEKAAEAKRREDERLAKEEHNRLVRKSICIAISVVLCIAVVVCAFVFKLPERSDYELGVLISIPIVLVVNSIIVTILGAVGSTKSCAVLPTISSLIVCFSCGYVMVSHVDGVLGRIISGIIVLVGIAIIVGVCFFIPFLALGVGSDD